MSVQLPIRLEPAASLYRGDARGRNHTTITLKDANGDAVDLTDFGDTWAAKAAAFEGSNETITLEVDDSQAAAGILDIKVPDSASADLPPSLKFDVQVTGGGVSPLTLFAGEFTVSGEVTT